MHRQWAGWVLSHVSAPIGAFGWMALAIFTVLAVTVPKSASTWPPNLFVVALLVGGVVMVLQPHISLFALRSSHRRVVYPVDGLLMLLLLACEGTLLANLTSMITDPSPLHQVLEKLINDLLRGYIKGTTRDQLFEDLRNSIVSVIPIVSWVVLGVTAGLALLHLTVAVLAVFAACAGVGARSASDRNEHRTNTTNRTSFEYRRSMERGPYQNKYDKLYE